ncbi:MAG: shikimate dehydrogenase [Thermoanaerobacteraceae bacterium]
MKVDSNTVLYGLIGHPVSHSISPLIHNLSFEYFNINSIYTVFDVTPENLENAVKGLKSLGIKGINVTVPHKENVIKYLDYISEEAKLIGAVNTIINSDGILKGYNTDYMGFLESISENNEVLKERDILLIGAGGAAKAILIALAKNDVNSITILNRDVQKAEVLAKTLEKDFNLKIEVYPLQDAEKLNNIDMIINATSVGMAPDFEKSPVSENVVKKANFVYDVIYNPEKTILLKYAERNNIKYQNGFSMVINQAYHSFKLWTGKNFDKNLVYKHIQK